MDTKTVEFQRKLECYNLVYVLGQLYLYYYSVKIRNEKGLLKGIREGDRERRERDIKIHGGNSIINSLKCHTLKNKI